MKISFEQRIVLFFSAIFIGIIIVGVAAYKNNQAFMDTATSLRHTLGIISIADQTVSSMKDIETGERGYIITGDPEFLEPAKNSLESVYFYLDTLDELTAENAAQSARVDTLTHLVKKKIELVANTNKLVKQNKLKEAQLLVASKKGKRLMDEIREMVKTIQDEENKLLVEQRVVRQKSISAMQNTLAFFVAGLFLLSLIVFLTIWFAFKERKTNEETLRRSNTFLDTILENIPNMIFVKDAKELRFIRFNKAGEKLLGYKREELLGKNDYDFFPKEQADFFTAKDHDVIDKNSLQDIQEETIQTKTGVRLLHTKKLPITDASGKPLFLMGISEDITERREAEEQLKDSERQVQTIFAAAPDAIIVIDEQGVINRWNSRAEDIFGWKAEEAIGKTLPQTIIPPQYREAHDNGMHKFLQSGHGPVLNKTIEITAIKKNGTEFFVELTISQTRLKGKYIFIGFLKDITERKIKDNRIKQLNIELENSIEQLQVSNKEMEAFTYSVSHDLRAPLRIINGFAEILVNDFGTVLNDEGRYHLSVIMSNSRHMGQLIDDLLNLSRLGRAAVEKRPVSMDEIVQEVIDGIKFTNPAFAPVVNLRELPPADCDPALIKQVWANLVANAEKYSRKKENPKIEIGSTTENGQVIYYIKDNGVGFDMQYAGKLFGVFQRLHKVSEFEGTGVGLATVHRIITKHGGKIWAEAKENEGATFYFTLG